MRHDSSGRKSCRKRLRLPVAAVADNERTIAHKAQDWVQKAIEAGAIEASTPYVGIGKDEVATLADSAFADRPLLVRLRTAEGDWRIVKSATWLVAWCAAEEPERIEGRHGVSFGPADVRDVFPVEYGAETTDPT